MTIRLNGFKQKVSNYATDQGKSTLYSIMYQKKQKDKNVQNSFKTL